MTKIAIIGAGRVATHLGRRMQEVGIPVSQVVSRTPAHAQVLGEALDCAWTSRWEALIPDADWVILAVKDDAIAHVAAQLAPFARRALATHTSGATPGAVLAPHFPRHGVFYPLQTFSADHTPDWDNTPVCIDAADGQDAHWLEQQAQRISHQVFRVNDTQRAWLHVGAVFANNFANHCFAIAEKILSEQNLPFDLLHPLMAETLQKALSASPAAVQTGPAVRGDQATIHRHLTMLQAHPDWKTLYEKMSESIQKPG
ncbi:MAG: DUF2520 domain-containing protein [Saprospiraceae bacterium]|nr:DUF2520 domain-containing protein [Saprospiraceae bacterium]